MTFETAKRLYDSYMKNGRDAEAANLLMKRPELGGDIEVEEVKEPEKSEKKKK